MLTLAPLARIGFTISWFVTELTLDAAARLSPCEFTLEEAEEFPQGGAARLGRFGVLAGRCSTALCSKRLRGDEHCEVA